MLEKIIKYGLFVCLLGLIFLPQYYLPIVQDKGQTLQAESLQGAFEKTKKPNFWPKKWLNGDFQKGYESYVQDRNEITPFFVRLNTEIDYSLFNTIPHHNIIAGKDGEFYTKTDCEAYVGLDFKGKNWIEDKVRKLKFIIEHYKKQGIDFAILLPAGKPGLLPEKMPDFYQNYPIDSTNRQVFLSVLKEQNIPHLDFDFLHEIKKDSPKDLFGQASLHWSRFAYSTTADSLYNFLNRHYDIRLPKIQRLDDPESKTQFSQTDTELINGANFLEKPNLRPLPYPDLNFVTDTTFEKPRVLSVGDSYYLSFYKNGIHDGFFTSNSKFLYYNHEVYPEATNNGAKVFAHDLDILSEIERTRLVILTVYETNLNRFGFNFIEKVYELIEEE